MHIHILGICGTFMAGIAVLAKKLGYTVTGSDAATYPPMSTQLEALGIECRSGYLPAHLEPPPDCVVIGNALSRGNPEVEAVLNRAAKVNEPLDTPKMGAYGGMKRKETHCCALLRTMSLLFGSLTRTPFFKNA